MATRILSAAFFAFGLVGATVVYDGRAPNSLAAAALDASSGPYTTGVKGSKSASSYTTLLGQRPPPTPLWTFNGFSEQTVAVSIDNSSVFVPGGNVDNSQFGFRRTELIARDAGGQAALNAKMETGTTVFHFSIKLDLARPLNLQHEYQIVFIEPTDGSHIFGVTLGSPFKVPTAGALDADARFFKVLDHANKVLFKAPATAYNWHNFAVQVDWDARSLAVLYSKDNSNLEAVTVVLPNLSANAGADGQGDFHFGVLKLPLANPNDAVADQGNVVKFGIQEGTTDGLLYSGVFVEDVAEGISIGQGATLEAIV